jgi:CBS domain containing-hemolysin-like protein
LLSDVEVRTMLDIGGEDNAIEEDEKEMVDGVLKLDYITVKSVMISKEDMGCLEVTQSIDSAVELKKVLILKNSAIRWNRR